MVSMVKYRPAATVIAVIPWVGDEIVGKGNPVSRDGPPRSDGEGKGASCFH